VLYLTAAIMNALIFLSLLVPMVICITDLPLRQWTRLTTADVVTVSALADQTSFGFAVSLCSGSLITVSVQVFFVNTNGSVTDTTTLFIPDGSTGWYSGSTVNPKPISSVIITSQFLPNMASINSYYLPPLNGVPSGQSTFAIFMGLATDQPVSSFPQGLSVTTKTSGCDGYVTFASPSKSGTLMLSYTFSSQLYITSVCGMQQATNFGQQHLNASTSPNAKTNIVIYNVATSSVAGSPSLFVGGYFVPDDGTPSERIFSISPFVSLNCPFNAPYLSTSAYTNPYCPTPTPTPPPCEPNCDTKAATAAAIVMGIFVGILAIVVIVLYNRAPKRDLAEPLVQ